MSLNVPTFEVMGSGQNRLECIVDATKCAEAYFGEPVAVVEELNGCLSVEHGDQKGPVYDFVLEVTFAPLALADRYGNDGELPNNQNGENETANADTTREDN